MAMAHIIRTDSPVNIVEEATKCSTRTTYPKPLVVPPAKEHKQTFILLHGRGSNASKFGLEILAAKIPSLRSLVQAFPHAKFIFPTASKRRAAIYNRTPIHQWFDSWYLQNPTEREELQIDDLIETSAYVHALLKEQIGLIGAKNVILGGLSQGCAASLVSLLTWDGEPLAAAVGMCGWLPFRKNLYDIVWDVQLYGHNKYGDEDPFSHSDNSRSSEEGKTGTTIAPDLPLQAVAYLREELNMSPPAQPMPYQQVPLFLGHGIEDEKVPVSLGREAASCLDAMGMDVRWREYADCGHWYSEAMLRDMVEFVVQRAGWKVE